MTKGFINANIIGRNETAFIVEDGIYTRFGTNEEIQNALSAIDETIDLNGAYVSVGFADSHMHLLELGHYERYVHLDGCKNVKEIQEALLGRVNTAKKDEWVLANGFNEENFDEKEMLERKHLDVLSNDVAICVIRSDGHLMVANKKAMQLCGMQEDSIVEGGTIDYERGILCETAINVMHDAMPQPSVEELKEDILKGAEIANRYGITAVGSDDFISLSSDWGNVLDAFMQLSYQGKLTVRVTEQCQFLKPEDFAQFLDEGYTTGVGDDQFKIGPLKIVADGSLGARTAALTKPYSDNASTSGLMTYSRSELKILMDLAQSYNMGTIIHAIGDRSVNTALKLFENMMIEGNPLHHGLVHCQIMTPEQVKKIIEMQIDCYYQSIFVNEDAHIVSSRVGEKRKMNSYPYRSLAESTRTANGTDAPVQAPDVMLGMEMAVTQTSLDGVTLNTQQTLTKQQAYDSFTVNGYEMLELNDFTGSMEIGKVADFTVLDRNPLESDAHDIHNIKVIMTVMDGKVVFE